MNHTTSIVERFDYHPDFGGGNFVTRHVDGRENETFFEYDDRGNLIHTQHRIESIVEDFEYNDFGQLTAHVLPENGSGHHRRDEFTYYDAGDERGYQKEAIVDAGGLNLTTTRDLYDLVGNVLKVTDPRGHELQFIFSELNQVVRTISREVADGGGVRYQRDIYYDANNNVVRTDVQNIDEQGNTHFTTVREFDILDFVTRSCGESGSYTGEIRGPPELPTCEGLQEHFITTEYAHDANRNRKLVRYGEATNGNDPPNVVSTFYDERDLIFRVSLGHMDPDDPDRIDPGQATTQYDYDHNGNLIRLSQGLESEPRITTHRYGPYDRKIVTIDAMGNRTELAYDSNHNLTKSEVFGELTDIEGPGGNRLLSQMSFQLDAQDRVVRTTSAFFDTETGDAIDDGSIVSTFEYSDNFQVTRLVNDNGHETRTEYDTANRVIVVTDAKNNTITYTYDENSNIIEIRTLEKSDIGGPDEVFRSLYVFDNLDRTISSTDSSDNVSEARYNSRHNTTFTTDALGKEIRYVYDGINRLTKTVRELDIVTTQTWERRKATLIGCS